MGQLKNFWSFIELLQSCVLGYQVPRVWQELHWTSALWLHSGVWRSPNWVWLRQCSWSSLGQWCWTTGVPYLPCPCPTPRCDFHFWKPPNDMHFTECPFHRVVVLFGYFLIVRETFSCGLPRNPVNIYIMLLFRTKILMSKILTCKWVFKTQICNSGIYMYWHTVEMKFPGRIISIFSLCMNAIILFSLFCKIVQYFWIISLNLIKMCLVKYSTNSNQLYNQINEKNFIK